MDAITASFSAPEVVEPPAWVDSGCPAPADAGQQPLDTFPAAGKKRLPATGRGRLRRPAERKKRRLRLPAEGKKRLRRPAADRGRLSAELPT
ncbi:hypothetical protein [Plantactinospora sonchi]|uniref:Uncharacterized protein n=1 Tax=Plantactinospora sonchi TaxID=1544735 RepID=A0ABU7RRU0_9ACTN